MPIDYSQRHLRIGWWAIFVFAGLGLVLETFHGFKIGLYLDQANETRRLMWRLAHAHGTLLGVVNVLFGLTLRGADQAAFQNLKTTSIALIGASLLLPVGFFLGGIRFYSGDPGLGVLLVPVGAVCLLTGLFLAASAMKTGTTPRSGGQKAQRPK